MLGRLEASYAMSWQSAEEKELEEKSVIVKFDEPYRRPITEAAGTVTVSSMSRFAELDNYPIQKR